ncbi:MAG: glycoside hydrolase family 16 protein [Flavobacteriaceae bacterium]|nr:glycoside hydrolase family 16 protein [Flavobacteriaceae bacterium]
MKFNAFFIGLISCFVLQGQATERKLVWADEFNQPKLNLDSWVFELGDGCPNLCGWGNNERQIYTKENHRLQDGNLVIQAKLKDGVYTSTRITTKDKIEYTYGRFEVRAKLPVGQGVWPAFWLLGTNITEVGWPLCGEIDVLEYVGKEPGEIFTSLHTQASHGETINTKKTKIDSIEAGFHIYAADWDEDQIEFFVDGESVYTFKPKNKSRAEWPFNQPFYMLLNLAIGGNFGGPEVDDRILPQEFIIDYVRVYQ